MTEPFLHDWLAEATGIPAGELTRPRLESYQLALLKQQLGFAKAHSSFYARTYAACNPQAIDSLEDLAAWPLTYPDDLKQHNDAFLATSQSRVWRIITLQTSGTTGAPKRLFFSETDLERTARYFHYSLKRLAWDCRELLVLMPGQIPGSVGDVLDRALADLPTRCHQFGIITDFAATLDYIRRHKIDFIIGIPSQVLNLCRYSLDHGGLSQIKGVLFGADYISPFCAENIRKHWGCRVVKHYGSTETALGAAVNCDCYEGCHIREAELLFEVVDPVTKRPLPDGEIGEIVISSLNYECMPLLRYNTGDLGAVSKTPCRCGSVLKRLTKMRPRHTLSLADGAVLDINELDAVLYQIAALPYFEAELRRGSATETLAIVLDESLRDALAGEITAKLMAWPVLTDAIRKGLLNIEITGRPHLKLGNPYVLKRKIAVS